jgi:hypothetical protein
VNFLIFSLNPWPILFTVLDCMGGGRGNRAANSATRTHIEEIAMASPVTNGQSAGRRRSATTPRIDDPHILTPIMRIALSLLLQAHETAARLHRDPWDFALEIHALKEAGVTHNDLRSLACQRLTEHRLERTRCGAAPSLRSAAQLPPPCRQLLHDLGSRHVCRPESDPGRKTVVGRRAA